jgi:hypothetical protein
MLTNVLSPLAPLPTKSPFAENFVTRLPVVSLQPRPFLDPLLPSPSSIFPILSFWMLADLITLFTLVLPSEPLECQCRFRTIRSRKVQKCAFSTFYVRSISFGPTIQQLLWFANLLTKEPKAQRSLCFNHISLSSRSDWSWLALSLAASFAFPIVLS